VLDASNVYNDNHQNPELSEQSAKEERQTVEEQSMSSLNPTSNHGSENTDPHQANKEVPSQASEEHCKEVQCIETNELRRRKSQVFSPAIRSFADANVNEEKHGESITSTAENAIQLYTCDSDPSSDTEKPETDESLALKRCVVSSRDGVLSRSRSCRASFMAIPNSWFDDSLDMNTTPPGEIFKYGPRRPEKARRSLYRQNDLPLYSPVGSGKLVSDEVADKSFCSFQEDDATNDTSYITEKKFKEQSISPTEKYEKEIGADSSVTTVESPSRWSINFEKKQKEIIELWQECNVSIVHRTYFFLLFKGDKADNIYLEVEHRRLSFIKSSLSAEGEPNATIASR
jgi:centromeric protein E